MHGRGAAFPEEIIRRQSAARSALSEGSSLIPMSCDFYGPEVAVTTFQLSLAAGGRQLGRNQLPPIPILVKGSERRFAIEDCETIRLCTPSYYREDAQSLIWDMQEGVIASNPRVKERWDDPADLEELRRDDAETAGRRPLVRAAGMIAVKTLKVRELEESTLFYGDNCLIWCSSMKPRNSKQWSLWRASLESSYDHVSTVRDPQIFARALGAMAFQQQGLLGNSIAFRNPQTGYVAQCLSLPVVYGPVVYVDDRRAYIEESSSDLEFVARSIFSKTSEHRHQREYRFAILSNRGLEDNTLDLTVSTEMRWSLTERQKIVRCLREIRNRRRSELACLLPKSSHASENRRRRNQAQIALGAYSSRRSVRSFTLLAFTTGRPPNREQQYIPLRT